MDWRAFTLFSILLVSLHQPQPRPPLCSSLPGNRLAPSCSLRNPTGWPPAPLPHPRPSSLGFHATLVGPVRYVFQLSRHPRLISLNLSPVSPCPRGDLGDISTVTPVTVHRGEHRPPRATRGTEVLLICGCNAHTNGGEWGLSLTYSLLFENTALCGECVFHWVCKGRGKKKKDETEGSENERASNYMTDLASGSVWLNRAPFPDIAPQSFHNTFPLSLMPLIFFFSPQLAAECVCAYVCVFSHFSPTRPANSGTCFSLWSPALPGLSAWVILAPDILTQGTGWGHGCVLCASFFCARPQGYNWMLLARSCCHTVDLSFFGHWITRLTLCWRRNSRLCLAKQTAPRLWQTLWAFSCTLLPLSREILQHVGGWSGGCADQKAFHIHMHAWVLGPWGGLDCNYYRVLALGKQVLWNVKYFLT